MGVGCGTDSFIRAVKDQIGQVEGMDYNDGMLKQAKDNLGGSVTLMQGSADNLPFETGKYDACCMNQVVHHFPKDEEYSFLRKSFEEAYRALKPGGVFHLNTSTRE